MIAMTSRRFVTVLTIALVTTIVSTLTAQAQSQTVDPVAVQTLKRMGLALPPRLDWVFIMRMIGPESAATGASSPPFFFFAPPRMEAGAATYQT